MKAKAHKESERALKEVPDSEERVLRATGRYLGEGFDDARLDTLLLTMPISWRGASCCRSARAAYTDCIRRNATS